MRCAANTTTCRRKTQALLHQSYACSAPIIIVGFTRTFMAEERRCQRNGSLLRGQRKQGTQRSGTADIGPKPANICGNTSKTVHDAADHLRAAGQLMKNWTSKPGTVLCTFTLLGCKRPAHVAPTNRPVWRCTMVQTAVKEASLVVQATPKRDRLRMCRGFFLVQTKMS
jgi:hypothetical protein